MKSFLSLLFFFFYLMIPMMSCHNKIASRTEVLPDSLQEASLAVLREVLHSQSQWVKVHAAEYLLWTGFPEGVREIYLAEEQQFGHQSPYRIGIWRVLAQAAATPGEKQVWTDKIVQAFLDTSGADRIHAAETLAKLHFSPETHHAATTAAALNSPVQSLSLYTRWSTAFTSAEARLQIRRFFYQLAITEKEAVPALKLAAYVVRHSGVLSLHDWEGLAKTALAKEEKHEARINLVNAAFVSAPDESLHTDLYHQLYKALIAYAPFPQKGYRMEVAAGLAEKGTPADLPVLVSYLKNEQPLGQAADDADVQATAAYAILRIGARYARP